MGLFDALPETVVSQLKSAGRVAAGNLEGARQTQEQLVDTLESIAQNSATSPLNMSKLARGYGRPHPPAVGGGARIGSEKKQGGGKEEARSRTKLQEAFNLPMGAKDIMDLAEQFDFSKFSEIVKDSEVLPFTCDLAPSFGTLDKESVRLMDDSLKVLISGTTRVIAGLSDKSWNNIVATLAQNSLIEQMGDEIFRSDELRKENVNYFKVDGSPDHRVVQEAQDWFNRLIADDDIAKSCGIDINVLGQIVAATGARVSSVETFFAKHEYHEQDILKIGVIRYPDQTHPYFKMYRIEVMAWSDCRRILFGQKDTNGIKGEIRVRKYKPCEGVIDRMNPAIIEKATNEAEALFAD